MRAIEPSRLAELGISVGNRVRFHDDLEAYPTYYIKAGETGTITTVSDSLVGVTLDNQHPGLDEWNNEVHFYPGDDPTIDYATDLLDVLPELSEQPEVG